LFYAKLVPIGATITVIIPTVYTYIIYLQKKSMKAVNYTSSLPTDLIEKLDAYSKMFKLPKNRIMEQALRAYFNRLKKAEYAHSFHRASTDGEMQTLAEEGIEDYLKIITEE